MAELGGQPMPPGRAAAAPAAIDAAAERRARRVRLSTERLTQELVGLLVNAPGSWLELGATAEILRVPKRRLAGIVGVLEELELLEQLPGGRVEWRPDTVRRNEQEHAQCCALQAELAELKREEQLLERHIWRLRTRESHAIQHPSVAEYLSVSSDDIAQLPSVGTDTVFAIAASSGTSMVIPDPDDGLHERGARHYRAEVTSEHPIGVWLVSTNHMAPDSPAPQQPAVQEAQPALEAAEQQPAPGCEARAGRPPIEQQLRQLQLGEQRLPEHVVLQVQADLASKLGLGERRALPVPPQREAAQKRKWGAPGEAGGAWLQRRPVQALGAAALTFLALYAMRPL